MITKINLLLFLLLSTIGLVTAQPQVPRTGNNVLPQVDFDAVEINGVSFEELCETNGEVTEMRRLFGSDLSYEFIDDILTYKNFGNQHLGITFNSDDRSYFYPQSIDFFTSEATIKIKGRTISVGDNIDMLGPGFAFNQSYGGVVFFDQGTESMCFSFKVDGNDLVIGIEFDAY